MMQKKNIIHYDINQASFTMNHTMTTLMDMNKLSHSVFALDSHALNDILNLLTGIRYEYSLYNTNKKYTSNMILLKNNKNNNEFF